MATKKNTVQLKIDEDDFVQLAKRLEIYEKDINDAVLKEMRYLGGELARRSTELVPVDVGELRSRVFNEGVLVDKQGRHFQVVGYEHNSQDWKNNPKIVRTTKKGRVIKPVAYAVPVHERLNVRHNVGQAKFLETAWRNFKDDYYKALEKVLKKTTENQRV